MELQKYQLAPETFVHKSRTGHIYAIRTTGKLFSEKRSVVVYANQERRTSKINDQNEVLAYIGEELNALSQLPPHRMRGHVGIGSFFSGKTKIESSD